MLHDLLDRPLPDRLADGDLVSRARDGDGGAFAEIMRRNNRRLFRLARGVLRDDAEAEEVVQETYVRAYGALSGWRGVGALSTWLSRIALNEALTRLRCRRDTVGLDTLDSEGDPRGGGGDPAAVLPEAAAARTELRKLIERAIDDLPAVYRTAFVLHALEQMPANEIAAAIGIAEITVRTRIFRARRLLRSALGRHVADALEGAFPFAGARCERLQDRVLRRLAL